MTRTEATDLVPLGERLRAMRWCRIAFTLAIAAAWWALPEVRHVPITAIAAAGAAWIAFGWGVEGAARVLPGNGRWAFGLLLTLDGAFLAWAGWGMAGVDAPLRYLVLLHIVAATLLASFRTGLKLALWHSLLLLCVFHAQEAEILSTHGNGIVEIGDVEFRSLVVYIAAFWAVAITVASFAAVNERELRRRRYDLEALRRLSARLERIDDAERISAQLIRASLEELDFLRAALLLPAGGGFQVATAGAEDEAVVRGDGGAPGAILLRVAENDGPLLLARVSPGDDALVAAALPGARNIVLVPLRADGHLVGVLLCEHGLRRNSRVERRVVGMLERFAAHAALALANAELVEQLRRSAAVDGLTGVANRRSFDETLAREVARAGRGGHPLGVVLVDLDHFKQLNDSHGHLAGDEALRAVAQALEQASRSSDLVARFGGEEFAVVLPDAGADEVSRAAERLRAVVANANTPIPVTASLGVAVFPADGGTGTDLVGSADRALYAAKRGGRDRIVTASGQMLIPPSPTPSRS